MGGGVRLCQKQNKPDLKRVSISHLPHFRLIFRGAGKGRERVCVACVHVHARANNSQNTRGAQSYLDERFAQSLLVDLQHNVPDLLIRQAEGAQENCCGDEEGRESFLLLF